MKIAIPTSDLKTVWTDHFGDATYFLIFELDTNHFNFIEARKNEEYEEEHHGDKIKFEKVVSKLQDVDAITAYDVGPNIARVKLISKKEVFIIRETTEISKFLEVLLTKLNISSKTLKGELFYEILPSTPKTEHAGFRDGEGKFEELLFQMVGPENRSIPATVTITFKK